MLRWKVVGLFLAYLGLWMAIASAGTEKASNQTVEQAWGRLLQENNARLRYLTSQVLKMAEQSQELLKALKEPPSSDWERALQEMKDEIEHLRLQVQLLTKALLALVGLGALWLIFSFWRSRSRSRYRSLRF